MHNQTPGRRSFAWQIGLVLVLAGLAIVAARFTSAKERTTMVPTASPAQAEKIAPPIDANAPDRTETATFALG
jgi:hypothetical protein